MDNLEGRIQTDVNNIICIYGDKDPWAALAAVFEGALISFYVFLKEGYHYSFINHFQKEKKKNIDHFGRLARYENCKIVLMY